MSSVKVVAILSSRMWVKTRVFPCYPAVIPASSLEPSCAFHPQNIVITDTYKIANPQPQFHDVIQHSVITCREENPPRKKGTPSVKLLVARPSPKKQNNYEATLEHRRKDPSKVRNSPLLSSHVEIQISAVPNRVPKVHSLYHQHLVPVVSMLHQELMILIRRKKMMTPAMRVMSAFHQFCGEHALKLWTGLSVLHQAVNIGYVWRTAHPPVRSIVTQNSYVLTVPWKNKSLFSYIYIYGYHLPISTLLWQWQWSFFFSDIWH